MTRSAEAVRREEPDRAGGACAGLPALPDHRARLHRQERVEREKPGYLGGGNKSVVDSR